MESDAPAPRLPSPLPRDPNPATVAGLFVVAIAPFLSKPLHLDDPMYVWAAGWIAGHPLDFYGFTVNWHGTATPMWQVMKNPPLVSYYLALGSLLTGWSEVSLHALMLPLAAGTVLGTWMLARLLTSRPGDAALAAAFTPVMLVSATTLMSDVPMLCAWVWALYFWVRGVREGSHLCLALGVVLAAVAALTKYFGIALLPLFALHGLLASRRSWRWAAWLLLPAAVLVGYQWGTERAYGRGLLLDASTYSSAVRARTDWQLVPKLGVGLGFAGGCLASALWYAPALWSRRTLGVGAALVALLTLALGGAGRLGVHAFADAGDVRWGLVIQLALAIVLGASVAWLAVLDLLRHRSPESALLAAWVGGTLFFAIALNWGVSARALLPLAPAFGILVARRLDDRVAAGESWVLRAARWAAVPAAVLSLLVAWSDQRLADSARDAATELAAQFRGRTRAIWFQGHWGFQFYAEKEGMFPLDFRHPAVERGDLIVKPEGISNPIALPPATVEWVADVVPRGPSLLSTMSLPLGAGFYSDTWGPLPFVVGRVAPQRYSVYRAVVPLREP